MMMMMILHAPVPQITFPRCERCRRRPPANSVQVLSLPPPTPGSLESGRACGHKGSWISYNAAPAAFRAVVFPYQVPVKLMLKKLRRRFVLAYVFRRCSF